MFAMPSPRRAVLAVLLFISAMLLVDLATAEAEGITIYTDKTAWGNALGGQFSTEDFSDDQLNSGVSFSSTESGHINPTLDYYQDVLASTSQNEPQTTWSFTPQISAYGGNWDLGGPGGSGNSLLVYVAGSYVGGISNSYNGDFWGVISDIPFTSVTLKGGSGTNQQNYTLDDMVYSSIPEPTIPGDAEGDGDVDSDDAVRLATYWGVTELAEGMTWWQMGDFNDDHVINAADASILAANWGYNSTTEQGNPSTAVPEPSVLAMLAICLVLLAGGRRRRVV